MGEVIAAIIGIALYGAACYYAVVWIVVPVWPFMVVGGLAIGALTVTVLVVGTLLGTGGLAPRTVTPADVPHRLPKIRSRFPRDHAGDEGRHHGVGTLG